MANFFLRQFFRPPNAGREAWGTRAKKVQSIGTLDAESSDFALRFPVFPLRPLKLTAWL
jgi:hypothetical protein